MSSFEPEVAARAVIPFFLRTLMKMERERAGLSRQAASKAAVWSSSTWGNFERNTRTMLPHHWINVAAVLGLAADHEVRRLNAFIGKHPQIWLDRNPEGEIAVCERALTSPRRIKSSKIVAVELDPIRPALYYELSSYNVDPEKVIEIAAALGFLKSRPSPAPVQPPEAHAVARDTLPARRERLCRLVMERLSDDKIGLLERVFDKFGRYPARDLARAYQHFSLSLSDKE